TCLCDNTWGTPVLQRPLALGADLALHATTKYLGGHSDVLGGVLVAARDDERTARLRAIQAAGGAVPSPFDCWLVLRGLRTLPLGIRAQSESALAIARFLREHAAVAEVLYPGLPGHAGHDVAARQMAAFGGMVSLRLRAGRAAALATAARVRVFTRATSLGGV